MRGFLITIDFVLRLVFFAVAPPIVVLGAALFPMGGAIANVGLALIGFVLAEVIRARAPEKGFFSGVLREQLKFDTYYREHAPKPFLYYVFYPLLFPYWLADKAARREFILFKGYTMLGLAILIINVVVQYIRFYPPDLGLEDYAPVVGLTVLLEALVVLALLMPLATTVISYHLNKRRVLLFVLLAVGATSTGIEIARLVMRRDPIVSIATRVRIQHRTDHQKKKAKAAQHAALEAALPLVLQGKSKIVEGDGKVEGEPLDRAHDALRGFYKEDEAFAFDLWAAPRKKPDVLVLYFESYRGKPAVWLAVDSKGHEIREVSKLPKGALLSMKHAFDE